MTDGMDGILMKPLTKAALIDVLAAHQGQAAAPVEPALDRDHAAEAREVLGPAGYARLVERFVQEVDDLLARLAGAGRGRSGRRSRRPRTRSPAAPAVLRSGGPFGISLKLIETAAQAGERDGVAELRARTWGTSGRRHARA